MLVTFFPSLPDRFPHQSLTILADISVVCFAALVIPVEGAGCLKLHAVAKAVARWRETQRERERYRKTERETERQKRDRKRRRQRAMQKKEGQEDI